MDTVAIREEHVEAVGAALAGAFMDDPAACHILPDGERRRRVLFWMYPRWVRALARRGESHTTPAMEGGALWRPPDTGVWAWNWDQVRAGLLLAPFILRPGELLRFRAFHADAMRRMRRHVTSPHWVLDVLGVSPDRQGCGVSRRMLSPTLSRADAQNLPCYLLTNKEQNIAIYGRFGFSVLCGGTLPGTNVRMIEMRRPSLSERGGEAEKGTPTP